MRSVAKMLLTPALLLGLAVFFCSIASAQQVTINDVYDIATKRQRSLKNVSVSYAVTFREFFKLESNEKAGIKFETIPYAIDLTADRDRRKMLRTRLTADGKPDKDPRAQLHVFDGSATVTYISGRMLMIYPDKIPETEQGDYYCSEVLNFPLTDQQRMDLDDSWFYPICIKPDPQRIAKYAVLPDMEQVDGVACLVLHARGFDKLWVDPALGYACRKREHWWGPDSANLQSRDHAWDFRDAGGGFMVPMSWTREGFPSPANPKEVLDKPSGEVRIAVSKVAVNAATDEDFKVKVGGGSHVIDHRSGRAYVMPGDTTDLLRELEARGQVLVGAGKSGLSARGWFFVVNLALLLVMLSLLIRRWLGRRSGHNGPRTALAP